MLSIHEYSVQSRKRIRISDFHNYLKRKCRNVVMDEIEDAVCLAMNEFLLFGRYKVDTS